MPSCRRLLTPRLASFHFAAPDVAIDLAVQLETADLETETFDAEIRRGPVELGQPGFLRLFDEKLAVLAAPHCSTARPHSMTPNSLPFRYYSS